MLARAYSTQKVSVKTPLHTLDEAWAALWPDCRKVLVFGLFTSLLALAPSWYMLEVYDRVINSRNPSTLWMLTLAVVFSYVILEGLEWVRRQLLQAAAIRFVQAMQQRVYEAAMTARLQQPDFSTEQVFSDFRTIRQVVASPAMLGVLDLPFALVFLAMVFAIHPLLGWLTLAGLSIQAGITCFNQWRAAPVLKTANGHAVEAQRLFSSISDRSDVVRALGMRASLEKRWSAVQRQFIGMQAQASDVAAMNAAASKFVQTLQGVLILGLGCHLVLAGEMPNGGAMMVVASIVAARALSPLIQLVTQWKTLAQGKEAYDRLAGLLHGHEMALSGMVLPPPSGAISVENLGYAMPVASPVGSAAPALFLRGIQFKLQPGDVLVVAGPSASGKTTLTRLLAGALSPTGGKVRFDGVDVASWDKSQLGPHVGYMPQQVALLDGTIADNIVRFGEIDQQALDEVLDLLGLREWIAPLPQGLETWIGQDGMRLSGGQRQLIGLARAAYGKPRIMILDEPNANLDPQGEKCFQQMVLRMKQAGTTFVIVSHLQNVVALADYLLVLMQGQVFKFGAPAEVMASFQPAHGKAGQA